MCPLLGKRQPITGSNHLPPTKQRSEDSPQTRIVLWSGTLVILVKFLHINDMMTRTMALLNTAQVVWVRNSLWLTGTVFTQCEGSQLFCLNCDKIANFLTNVILRWDGDDITKCIVQSPVTRGSWLWAKNRKPGISGAWVRHKLDPCHGSRD